MSVHYTLSLLCVKKVSLRINTVLLWLVVVRVANRTRRAADYRVWSGRTVWQSYRVAAGQRQGNKSPRNTHLGAHYETASARRRIYVIKRDVHSHVYSSSSEPQSQGIFKGNFRTAQARGSGGWKSPRRVQGRSPVGGLKDEVPQKLKHIVIYCNKF